MAGYSTTTQARKLGLKPGLRVSLLGAPDGWALADPPDDLEMVEPDEPADVVLWFVTAAAQLTAVAEIGELIRPAGGLWVLWPRKAAGHVSDMTEDLIREYALPLGLVDNKVAAVEDDWSGLRLVWRLIHR